MNLLSRDALLGAAIAIGSALVTLDLGDLQSRIQEAKAGHAAIPSLLESLYERDDVCEFISRNAPHPGDTDLAPVIVVRDADQSAWFSVRTSSSFMDAMPRNQQIDLENAYTDFANLNAELATVRSLQVELFSGKIDDMLQFMSSLYGRAQNACTQTTRSAHRAETELLQLGASMQKTREDGERRYRTEEAVAIGVAAMALALSLGRRQPKPRSE